jgi:hypothetical protein
MTTNPPSIANSAATVPVNAGSDTTKNDQTDRAISFKWLVGLGFISLSLIAFYYFNFGYHLEMGFGNQADFGAFGDFLGGVLNPILGFATVALLIWSLKMQRQALSVSNQELSLTRQELKETKQETALSRQAMQDQVEHLQKEAKLNELIRLMAAVKIKCDEMLNSNVTERELSFDLYHFSQPRSYDIYRPSITERTYRNVIYFYIPSKTEELYKDLIPLLQRQYNELNSSWKVLEELLCVYARLALRYYDFNKSPEFAVVYMKEAGEMLAPFHQIFQTEETSMLLQRIINADNIAMSSMLYADLDD